MSHTHNERETTTNTTTAPTLPSSLCVGPWLELDTTSFSLHFSRKLIARVQLLHEMSLDHAHKPARKVVSWSVRWFAEADVEKKRRKKQPTNFIRTNEAKRDLPRGVAACPVTSASVAPTMSGSDLAVADVEVLTVTLVGFGSVNRAFARLVAASEKRLATMAQPLRIRYHAVVARHGAYEAAAGSDSLSPAVVAALADKVEKGEARLDGSTGPAPENCTVTVNPSTQQTRDIISRSATGVRVAFVCMSIRACFLHASIG